MNRRVIKPDGDFDAYREARPAVHRHFASGTVLNILQWIKPDTARFTIEGEDMEVWCCPQSVIDERSESPQAARA
jgi:hypothetical protein